jgi:methyl-accepting chemotaxis protein
MWKDNLKISTRLVLGFGSMIVLMVIMTIVTILLSTRADDQFHVVTDELMPKIDLLHKTKEQIFATELALTHVVLDFNPENVKRQQAVVEAGRQKITQAFEELSRLVVHDKGRAML